LRKNHRTQIALLSSLVIHAFFGALIFDFFRSLPLQVQITSIEVITESSEPGSAHPIVKCASAPTQTQAQTQTQALAQGAPGVSNEPAHTGSGSAINSYLGVIREKLSGAIRLPNGNIKSPLRVLLKVTLLENGEIKEPKIEAGSGSSDFDRSVLDALERARPFPAFTKEMASMHEITLRLPVEIRPHRH
jgi:TonB family protein